jgi:hypothetical protein
MNIRSAKVDELAQRLARLTGEDIETALERAIEERLSRVASPAIDSRPDVVLRANRWLARSQFSACRRNPRL